MDIMVICMQCSIPLTLELQMPKQQISCLCCAGKDFLTYLKFMRIYTNANETIIETQTMKS